MRALVLDPRIIAAGFLDPADRHGILRLLGLLAYGRLSLHADAAIEEEALRDWTRRSGPDVGTLGRAAEQQRERVRAALAGTAPDDLVLAMSVGLLDEVGRDVDRAREWSDHVDPGLGHKVRRIVSAITGVLVAGAPREARGADWLTREMLVVAAQSNARLVTQSESLAPAEWETYRVAVGEDEVVVLRLETFIEQELNRYPFDLRRDVPEQLLELAVAQRH